MYERFSEQARQVMIQAAQEARSFNHEYVGTEHILVGIMEFGGAASQLLGNVDVDTEEIREEILRIVQMGPEMEQAEKLPHTPRAKQALKYATDEAQYFKQKFIEPEHLLFGLIREDEGVAAEILRCLEVDLDDLAREVFTALRRL